MYIYAQINGEGIVFAVSILAGPVDRPDMIRIDEADYSLLGQQYDPKTGQFVPEEPSGGED